MCDSVLIFTQDSAAKRKMALAAVIEQMQDMLAREGNEAQLVVDSELETGQSKLDLFMKRLTENTKKMKKARENINSLLSQSQSTSFLKVG